MILTLEGAPATGKSFLAKALVARGATRIAEVNELWHRPAEEAATWYLRRQLDRYAMARAAQTAVSVLDGDCLQPIWFGWLYPDRVGQSWQYALRFFRDNSAYWGVPDQFVLVHVPEAVRVQRELGRSLQGGRSAARAQEKAQKYSAMAQNLALWFEAMSRAFPGLVSSLDNRNAPTGDGLIAKATRAAPCNRALLDWAEDWLASHRPIGSPVF